MKSGRRKAFILVMLVAAISFQWSCYTAAPARPAGSPPSPAPIPVFPTPPATSPVSSAELKVVGNLNVAAGPGNITDVWAHTAASGKSYAYLGSFDQPRCGTDITGVHIVDITDANNPVKVGFLPSPEGTRANDVKVERLDTPLFRGDILVHSVEICSQRAINGQMSPEERASTSAGIVLYDVTDPLAPKRLAPDFSLNMEVHNTFIYQQGERAYVLVVQDEAERDFHIVEITNPAAPAIISSRGWKDWLPEGAQVALGTVPVPFVHDVWARSFPPNHPNPNYAGKVIAYLSYWDAGLILLDITDPANPVFLGDSDYVNPDPVSGQSPEGNSHAAVPTEDGSLVFMGDEDFVSSRTLFSVETGSFADTYRARQSAFTRRIAELDGKQLAGMTVFVGQGCDAAGIPAPPRATAEPGAKFIALIERGVCPFEDKVKNAADAGYDGVLIFAGIESPNEVISMSGDPAKGVIPALFVPRPVAFAILGMSPDLPPGTPLPAIGTIGERISIRSIFDGWGYGRILDVSDPKKIVELGQFVTENVMAEPVPPGDHSMHNVVIEGRRAYISWYADGIRVVDFSEPEKPFEVARFVDSVSGSDFWGVYLFKHPDGNTYILGSDRSTGLWIFAVP
ncbi:MAG: hypothetical protein HYX79_04215 [Chloroflexi bacterium]|nr:hypothetical protein [Chloroflexota bacterium]